MGSNYNDNVSHVDVGQLSKFLGFLSKAHSFLDQKSVSKHHPTVTKIRSEVEEKYTDSDGKPAIYQKYESAFYEDAPNLVTLWEFFKDFDRKQLHQYQKLVGMELAGIKGDYHPLAIMGRSVLGTAALLLSSLTFWWGLIKLVSVESSGSEFTQLLQDLLNPDWVNRIVGTVAVVGMFVLIWYVLRMVRNRKQVAFLSSLGRALELYLFDSDS